MPEMSRKEVIRILTEKLKYLRNHHGEGNDFVDALKRAISDLEMMERVSKGGVNKFTLEEAKKFLGNGWNGAAYEVAQDLLNSAIDLCNAKLAERLRNIGEIMEASWKKAWENPKCRDRQDRFKLMKQAIITHLTSEGK